jgi:hypothetical protein
MQFERLQSWNQMRWLYEICRLDFPRWHDILVHTMFHDDRFRYSSNIKVRFNNLRGCSVDITDGRDLWVTPFRWSHYDISGLTIKLANSPLCACRGNIGQKPQHGSITLAQVYYLEVLKRLYEKVRRKRPELFANNSWILQHDNAPDLTALCVRDFLASKHITVLEYRFRH